jgi:surface antigen
LAAATTPIVRADQFDQQIKDLQSQNSGASASVGQLQAQANTYQDAISQLQAQIGALQGQITDNQNKQASLAQQITDKQNEIIHQRAVLGDDIKAMYVDGQITTIEQLATSKDLSDFVDKEEYRNTIQTTIQNTLKQIASLQQQLQGQKAQIDQLLTDQKSQQSQLASAQSQQNSLLAYNQQQQTAYTQQIQANSSKISDLRRQQAAANAALFASGNGTHLIAGNNGNDTYPNSWRNASQDSLIDSWGMYNRECVSYTAWKVAASGRHMPYWGGVGNANQWDDDARAANIPVDGNPKVGDVAIKNSGPYGHAMYVEHVYADGAIYVSQYNASLNGTYSEAYISAATISAYDLVFIHF